MELNADFSRRVVVHSARLPWVASPMAGVSRRMLDRVGDEIARATSVVRYAPGSSFSPHVHTGGEEFLVLEGIFQDEHGDFPAGSYIRNPPQSRHTPGSEAGCVILVKLWQFDLDDRTRLRTRVDDVTPDVDAARPGVLVRLLHQDRREQVVVEEWPAGTEVELNTAGGAEAFVLDGGFEQAGEALARHSWLRLPAGGDGHCTAGPRGTRVWIKTGHLAAAPPLPPVPG